MTQGLTIEPLLRRYREEAKPALVKEFGYENVLQAPRLDKVVLNIGLGEALQNGRAIETATRDLATVTGQKPIVTRAKKSIAAFKLRAGVPIGACVTLRGGRMYAFLGKLFTVVLPRVRDFRGLPDNSFDGRGNYSIGLREQLVFPEIEYDSIDRVRGLQVTIVTTARTDEEGRRLLELLGCPIAATTSRT